MELLPFGRNVDFTLYQDLMIFNMYGQAAKA